MKTLEENINITLADNGILYESHWKDTDVDNCLVMKDEEEAMKIGEEILASVKSAMDIFLSNKIRMKIIYEPVNE